MLTRTFAALILGVPLLLGSCGLPGNYYPGMYTARAAAMPTRHPTVP